MTTTTKTMQHYVLSMLFTAQLNAPNRHAHMENQQLTKDEKGEHKWREKGWGKWRENESGSGRRSMRARANLSFFVLPFSLFPLVVQ